jgi:hypothetical protein
MHTYIGDELTTFEHALRWKAYFSDKIRPYIKGHVLEVGAGIGSTTKTLCQGDESSWLCLEPDPKLAKRIEERIKNNELPPLCQIKVGTIEDVSENNLFDTILYIDVIEHIENDYQELDNAVKRLNKNGVLIVLVPAFQYFYSPFDKAIGHFRRYNKRRLLSAIPEHSLNQEAIFYLDAVGLMASFANKLLLKQSYPTKKQIYMWDNYMIPISKYIDPAIHNIFGKSLIGVWRKT